MPAVPPASGPAPTPDPIWHPNPLPRSEVCTLAKATGCHREKLSRDVPGWETRWCAKSGLDTVRPWGPSHKNVPPGGQALRLPGAGLEVCAHGPCGLLLACPMPTSLHLAPRPGPQLAPCECLNNQMPTTSGTRTWLPLTLTSSPLHTCQADSPITPSLEPRNLSLCLVKGTLGLLQIMGPGQLIKGEGAYYRVSAADPLLGTHLGASRGQSTLTTQALWC